MELMQTFCGSLWFQSGRLQQHYFQIFKAFCCPQIIISTLSIEWKHGSIFLNNDILFKRHAKKLTKSSASYAYVLRLSLVYVGILFVHFSFSQQLKKVKCKEGAKKRDTLSFLLWVEYAVNTGHILNDKQFIKNPFYH